MIKSLTRIDLLLAYESCQCQNEQVKVVVNVVKCKPSLEGMLTFTQHKIDPLCL